MLLVGEAAAFAVAAKQFDAKPISKNKLMPVSLLMQSCLKNFIIN
jgi:hypothetical protein